jgi:hypothetical protein
LRLLIDDAGLELAGFAPYAGPPEVRDLRDEPYVAPAA